MSWAGCQNNQIDINFHLQTVLKKGQGDKSIPPRSCQLWLNIGSILDQNNFQLKWSKRVYKRKTIGLDQLCVKGCHNFTYFANDVGKRCILFRHCPSTMPCMKCVSGPRMPPIMKCGLAKKSATTKNTGVTGVNQLLNGKIPSFLVKVN